MGFNFRRAPALLTGSRSQCFNPRNAKRLPSSDVGRFQSTPPKEATASYRTDLMFQSVTSSQARKSGPSSFNPPLADRAPRQLISIRRHPCKNDGADASRFNPPRTARAKKCGWVDSFQSSTAYLSSPARNFNPHWEPMDLVAEEPTDFNPPSNGGTQGLKRFNPKTLVTPGCAAASRIAAAERIAA